MIDFQNASFLKLRRVADTDFYSMIAGMLVDGEGVVSTYRGIRDGVVFTNKRIISINVQGVTGKKKDFTSMPYSRIQVYSVESAGVFDLDSELQLYFSGIGRVTFEFTGDANVSEICKMISGYVLK